MSTQTDNCLRHESYLIQRLCRPMDDHPMVKVIEAFSFGGGLRNGGLSDEAMDLLRPIFTLDYMGSAEFEWGAVPKAISTVVKSNPVAFSFSLDLSTVKTWKKPLKGKSWVGIICPRGWETEVEQRFRDIVAGKCSLKEVTLMHRSFDPDEDDATAWRWPIGWLELDNGWFAFKDQDAWRATGHLLSAKVLSTER